MDNIRNKLEQLNLNESSNKNCPSVIKAETLFSEEIASILVDMQSAVKSIPLRKINIDSKVQLKYFHRNYLSDRRIKLQMLQVHTYNLIFFAGILESDTDFPRLELSYNELRSSWNKTRMKLFKSQEFDNAEQFDELEELCTLNYRWKALTSSFKDNVQSIKRDFSYINTAIAACKESNQQINIELFRFLAKFFPSVFRKRSSHY
ncbi:hypothetical protein CDAR_410001 [Caerostris darwini]|uniref:Uncharacterized protein n=1 Tax=Caerostris darwini TaxID=1538125 RepID=A0AAV4VXW1_9ARAC|nr:hypothetical protein CDAR_410001 [Caerostris darwini]